MSAIPTRVRCPHCWDEYQMPGDYDDLCQNCGRFLVAAGTPPLAPDSDTERLLEDASILIDGHRGDGNKCTVETLTSLCAKVRELQTAYLCADECAKRCQANGERDAARAEVLEAKVRELQADLAEANEVARLAQALRHAESARQPAKDSQ